MTDNNTNDNLPDPLANLQKIFGVILEVLTVVFTKIVPILGLGFLAVLFILYFFFKFLGF